MGVYFSVQLERDLPGVWVGEFRRIARAAKDLEKVARKLRVPGVWEFYDPGPEGESPPTTRPKTLRGKFWWMIGDIIHRVAPVAPDPEPREVRWHDAASALRSFRLVHEYVRQHPESLARAAVDLDETREDFNDLEVALEAAAAADVRFYLALYT
jgi:hypothetical protein